MNYYNHHLGDYDGATAHLSWDEDQAYTRLLRVYYRLEKPIPADLKAACRLVRAASKAQQQAVERVLAEFFTLKQDGWHNKRCDEELAGYHSRIEKSRNAAAMRWHSERNALASPEHAPSNGNQPPTSNNQPPTTNPPSSESPKSFEKKPLEINGQRKHAIQNPAWLIDISHAKMLAKQLGIDPGGKTHQELKDAITTRLEQSPAKQPTPKFA